MRGVARAMLITLLGLLALLGPVGLASALPAAGPAATVRLAGQQPPATTAPAPTSTPAATNSPTDVPPEGDARRRVTIGIIAAVLIGLVVVGRRLRKRWRKSAA